MDTIRLNPALLRLEHRHGDDWAPMERREHHDVSQHDPERSWAGAIYECAKCDDAVRVRVQGAPDDAA